MAQSHSRFPCSWLCRQALFLCIAAAIFSIVMPLEARAACTSPTAADGAKEWFSGSSNYKYCIGSTWVDAAKGATLTACSTAGQWDWDAGGFTKMCDGTNWIKMGCFSGGGGGGGGHGVNGSFSLGGYNWYAGHRSENCDQTCANRGGCNLTGTMNYAGSAGTNANCLAVLQGLMMGSSPSIGSGSGTSNGCHVTLAGYRQRTTTVTTCASSYTAVQRACACNNSATPVASQVCNASSALAASITPRKFDGLYHDGTYVYGVSISDGLFAYTFNGSSFTQVATYNTAGSAYGVTAYGSYVVVGDDSAIRALTFNGSAFTLRSSLAATGRLVRVWNDGTYFYASDDGNGFKAYTFNGTTLTQAGSSYALGTSEIVLGYYKAGTYIYAVIYNQSTYLYELRVLQFNGAAFTELTNAGTRLADVTNIAGDGTNLYVTSNKGISAYTFNGTSFTQVGNSTGPDSPGGVFYAAGGMVLAAHIANGMYTYGEGNAAYIYSFDGSNFVLQGAQMLATTHLPAAVAYRSGYVFSAQSNTAAGTGAGSLNAASVSLSSCGSVGGSCSSLGACSTAGQIDYDSGGSLVKQCDGANWYGLDANHASLGGGSDVTAPVWVSPAAGATIATTAFYPSVTALSATDNSGVVRFVRVGGFYLATASTADGKLVISAGQYDNTGPYSVTIRAYDLSGNYADRSFNITVSGTKVLCTYYNSRGMLPDEILQGDLAYSEKVHPLVGRAYRAWANPMIAYIKKHEGGIVDKFGFFLVKNWANEMAYRTGHGGEHNMTGWLLSKVGEPLHYLAGHFIPETEDERQIRLAWEARRAMSASAATPVKQ